jgi:tyrosine-protein kinase Etk/Wzc
MPTIDEISHEVPVSSGKSQPMEFDLLDLLVIFAAGKRIIFLTTAACLALAIGLGYWVSPTFTGKAVILPPQQDQSSGAALLGQLGGLASLGGGGGLAGLRNPIDLYVGILQSQSVADTLIKRFDLMHRYHAKRQSDARAALKNSSKIVAGKDGMITVSVTDSDPRKAADLANAYVDALYSLNNRLALGAASQRRLFFEQQLAQEKDQLADAEVALKKTEETTGVIAPSGQTETVIRQVAQLQAEITSREVQLGALRTSSTDQNPQVIQLSAELNALRGQLRDLENGGGKHAPGDISITTANVPQAGLEYIRKEREVKYHQMLFDLLARQYEAARLDEAKAAPVIQVVDPALVPDKKSAPYRALWALIGCVLGFLIGTAWVIGSHIYRHLESDEEHGRRLALLRRELSLRR